jgi:hypothetical protein
MNSVKKWYAAALSVSLIVMLTTPVVARAQQAQPQTVQKPEVVKLDDITDHPERYVGKTVTVEAKVDDVLGPQIFKVEEPNLLPIGGEMFVYVEAPLAALVKRGDKILITGTVTPAAEVQLQRRWGWLKRDPEVDIRLKARPVLVAKAIMDPERKIALITEPVGAGTPAATGTSGSNAPGGSQPVASDIDALAGATNTDLVGRRVRLNAVKVERADKNGGFWARAPSGESLFVLPATENVHVTPGQTVNLEGYVLEMPKG